MTYDYAKDELDYHDEQEEERGRCGRPLCSNAQGTGTCEDWWPDCVTKGKEKK